MPMKRYLKKKANGSTTSVPKNAVTGPPPGGGAGTSPNQSKASESVKNSGTASPASAVSQTSVLRRVSRSSPITRKASSTTLSSGESR